MRSTLLVILALSFSAVPATSPQAQSINGHIVDYGIYSGTKTKTKKSKNVAAGIVTTSTNIKLVKRTTDIPGKLNIRFGFRCKIDGSNRGKSIQITKKTLYPPPGLKNPKRAKLFTEGSYNLSWTIGNTRYTGYRFDDSWEIVPGRWTMQLWYKNKLLCGTTFKVKKP